MQKYSKYQATDLLWMGEVPSHWRKNKISRMVEFSASGGTPTSTNESYYDGDIKWVQTGELNDCEIFDTEKKLTEEGFKASSTKLFPAETLLVAMYGATIGKLGILKTEAATNQACCALFFNTKKWNTKYFFYYFLNIREKLIFSSYGGGQPNISQEVIKQERLFVPPFTEQTAIAAYLDQATANIDQVIATKQKQLEKLEQYKQSKIHECVTKGLNSDVTLKPSGIDWIGEVPVHWRLDKISRIVDFSASGGTPTSTNENYYGGDIKWVQTGELNDCEIFDTERKLTEDGFKASSTKLFPPETLLVAMYGATIGKLGILKAEATTNQACCALFFNPKKWNEKFFFYYFLSIRKKLIFSSYGGGQPNISQEVIKQERLFVPKYEEQNSITEYLDNFCEKISKEKSIIEQQIEKLKQYRKSLIHECVTGKRKVIND